MRVARPELPAEIPGAVRAVVDRVVAGGGRAWPVGGTVRDLVRGVAPRDFDIATDRTPAELLAVIPDADAANARLGSVRVDTAVGEVSLTTLRREADYSDHRRPDTVEFVRDLDTDAARRDFTINALYLDCGTGEIIDPTGGLADLEAGVLRTIGEPVTRFTEDHLRLLRAVRFAARFDLTIAPATASAIRQTANHLATLAPERAFSELTAMFTGPGRGRALRLLVELGIAAVLLPEVAAMDGVTQPPEYHPEGDVLTHVALVLDHVPAGDAELAWAAVLHDIGKPPTWRQAEDRIRFDGHDALSARMAVDVLQRFRASRRLIDLVADICRDHIRFAALPSMRPRRRERWLRSPDFERHLAFHRADCLGSHGKLQIHEFAARELAALPPLSEPLVTGKDVLALGVPPGPHVGKILREVERRADEATMPPDRSAALVLLREAVERRRQAGELPAR